MAKQKQRIIVVVGPTASGKSALAVELARHFDGEIISADSRQVYRGLDIGTGKITSSEMRDIRHHLLDVASTKNMFTAHDFIEQGRAAMHSIAARGKLPIICGGTGFYIDALLGRITLPDVAANFPLRTSLEKKSAEQLFRQLQKLDGKRAAKIDPHNKRRLIRAIEIAKVLGKSPRPKSGGRYHVLWIGLALSPDVLRKRINKRLKKRLHYGMLAEAKRLHVTGLSYKRMCDFGLEYRSLARFLQKEISREELERELQVAIWHYARRQMSYWKRNKEIRWFKPNEGRSVRAYIETWLAEGF